MSNDAAEQPTIEDHPGLDNDEATDEGRMMTAEGSIGATTDEESAPTLEAHPGLDDDEATAEGKMMTAEGSTGPRPRKDVDA